MTEGGINIEVLIQSQRRRNLRFFSEPKSTQGLTIDFFTQKDITNTYLTWLRDRDLMKFSDQQFLVHDVSSCEKYVQSFQNSQNLFLKISSPSYMVGTATIYIDVFHETANAGILLGSEWIGQGFGKIAWSFLVNDLAPSVGIRKISAGTASGNIAMIKLFEQAGMTMEAKLDREKKYQGSFYDVLIYTKFLS